MKWILWVCLFAVAPVFAEDTNLTLTIGAVTYNNVRFVRSTPATVTIFHSTGVATIPWEKLPPDLQKQFGYDPQLAAQRKAAAQQAAAEAAEVQRREVEAQKLVPPTAEWKLRVESVLADGVIARGCIGTNYCPNPIAIVLVDPPNLRELAEGDEITAIAYRDGVAKARNSTLQKWVFYQPKSPHGFQPPPAVPPSVVEEPKKERPQVGAGGVDVSIPDLRTTGAFGFPQAEAKVLCNRPALRFSVFNNDKYLFAQAVLWKDDDSSPGKNDDGAANYDYSMLILDLDGDGKATRDVDRSYTLNPVPGLPGLNYQIYLGPNGATGLRNDSKGRGAIRYANTSDGKRVRVDTYLIPLNEISRRVGDKIGLYFYAYSPKPPLSVNSVNFDMGFRFFEKGQPYVLRNGNEIDPSKIPDGRTDDAVSRR